MAAPVGASPLFLLLILAMLTTLLAAGWRTALAAEGPPGEPIMRLETGMHTAQIWRIGVDAVGRLLLATSLDKIARLWSLQDGRLLQVLRPPVGAGNEGKLYAGALSPDGRLAAVAGWTGAEVGRFQQRLSVRHCLGPATAPAAGAYPILSLT